MTDHVTVRYVNCDRNAESPDSFMNLLVSYSLKRPVRIVRDAGPCVDLQFTSVQLPLGDKVAHLGRRILRSGRAKRSNKRDYRWEMQNPNPIGRARAHVWFTGENVRPPIGDWDGYFSFDIDRLGGRNVYLPLWWHSIGLLGRAQSPFMTPAPQLRSLLSARRVDTMPDAFAVAFLNNPQPMRLHAIASLGRFGKVDVYGRAVGRPIKNKAELSGRYRYCLCFENDLYPGYVTEKAIEAWSVGAIPLWWGLDPAGYLNADSMFNAADFSDMADMAAAAEALCQDPDEWRHKAELPLLARAPDLKPAMALIRDLV